MELTTPTDSLRDLVIVFVGIIAFLYVWRIRAYWWHPYRVARMVGDTPVRRYHGATWAWIVVGFAALVMAAAYLTLTGVLGSGPLIDRVFPNTDPEELARYIVATFDLISHGAALCVIGATLTEIARTSLRWKWPRRAAMILTSLVTAAGGIYALVFIFVIVWRW